jgi:hypothetical protein
VLGNPLKYTDPYGLAPLCTKAEIEGGLARCTEDKPIVVTAKAPPGAGSIIIVRGGLITLRLCDEERIPDRGLRLALRRSKRD